MKGVYQKQVAEAFVNSSDGRCYFGDGRIIPRPEHAEIVAAIREEGEATRQNPLGSFGKGFCRSLVYPQAGVTRARHSRRNGGRLKCGASGRLLAWTRNAGLKKWTATNTTKRSFKKDRIESLEHFKAVIDNARK